MLRLLNFDGNPCIGVFATSTDDVLILPPDIPNKTVQKACNALGV